MICRAVISLLAGATALTGAGLAATPAAWANGGDAIGLDIHYGTVSKSVSGTDCTWDVHSTVTVVNLTDQPLQVSAVGASVSWSGNGASAVDDQVTFISTGGLGAGDSIPAQGTVAYSPVETVFTIPCSATFGDLAVRVTDQLGTGSGDAPFLSDGVPLPVTAVGGVALAGLLGLTLLFLQRRRRVPAAAPSLSDLSNLHD